MKTTLMTLTVIAALTACGGSDGNDVDNLVSCGPGWDTAEPGLSLSGLCAERCQVFPAIQPTDSCKRPATINGEPGFIECNESGYVIKDGDGLGCCDTTGREVPGGAVFDVLFYECE